MKNSFSKNQGSSFTICFCCIHWLITWKHPLSYSRAVLELNFNLNPIPNPNSNTNWTFVILFLLNWILNCFDWLRFIQFEFRSSRNAFWPLFYSLYKVSLYKTDFERVTPNVFPSSNHLKYKWSLLSEFILKYFISQTYELF